MTEQSRFIAYYRISARPRKRSSPDLQTQREAVRAYYAGLPCAEFIEIGPACKSRWCQLEKALATAQKLKAVLVVAKLGRLTRSSEFLSRLLQSGTELYFCDLPSIQSRNYKLFLKRLIAKADRQAERTSVQTKVGLQAAKRRGIKLGGLRAGAGLSSKARAYGRAVREEKANAFACAVGPIIESIRRNGTSSFSTIAMKLSEDRVPSARGGRWTGTQVSRVRDRFLTLSSRAPCALARDPQQGRHN